MGKVQADDGTELPVAGTFAGSPSLTVDAVIVPGGDLQSLSNNGDFHYYLLEAYKHLKPILLAGDARRQRAAGCQSGEEGIVETDAIDNSSVDALITLMAAHRVWSRSAKIAAIPA
jgi:catalase